MRQTLKKFTLVYFLALIQGVLVLNAKEPIMQQQDQSIVISGVITDRGEPLTGVSVSVKGTNIGTVSDLDGKYSITVLKKESVLVFS